MFKKSPDSNLVEQLVLEFTLKDQTDSFVLPVKGNCTRIMVTSTSTSLENPVSAHFDACKMSICRSSISGYYGNENGIQNSIICKYTDNRLVLGYNRTDISMPEISYKAFVIDL